MFVVIVIAYFKFLVIAIKFLFVGIILSKYFSFDEQKFKFIVHLFYIPFSAF